MPRLPEDTDPTPVDEVDRNELGVEHDMAAEYAIEAEHAVSTLREMYVDLDCICDSHDLPGEPVSVLRSVQDQVSKVADALEREAEQARERQKALRERLLAEVDDD